MHMYISESVDSLCRDGIRISYSRYMLLPSTVVLVYLHVGFSNSLLVLENAGNLGIMTIFRVLVLAAGTSREVAMSISFSLTP